LISSSLDKSSGKSSRFEVLISGLDIYECDMILQPYIV
jgi:hypothetical protein